MTEKIKLTVSTIPLCHSQKERDPEDGDGAIQVGRAQNLELPGPLSHPIRERPTFPTPHQRTAASQSWRPCKCFHEAASWQAPGGCFRWLSAASVTWSREMQLQLWEQVLCGI